MVLSRHMNNKKGFTLIELVLAIVILAILSTIAIPSVSSFLNNANQATDNAKSELYEGALRVYVSQKAQIREYVALDENNRQGGYSTIILLHLMW